MEVKCMCFLKYELECFVRYIPDVGDGPSPPPISSVRVSGLLLLQFPLNYFFKYLEHFCRFLSSSVNIIRFF